MSVGKGALWYKDAIFYELYIRAFYDSNSDGHGDLLGIIQKLDYFKELGVDCIWLLPMYPSPLKDDGYDIADYYGIHPDYGTVEDFEQLVQEAHTRGLRVIADLAINHTSDQHPWFIESRSSRDNPRRDWYVWSDTDDRYSNARIIFIDTEHSNWEFDARTRQFYWHRFYASQPDLNYDNPEVRQAMKEVMAFWLDRGIDGFRVDAVPYLFEREGTDCENLPETHAYIRELRQFMNKRWPNAIMLAEANQPLQKLLDYFGTGNEFHMALHFPLMPPIFTALKTGHGGPIRQAIEETHLIPESCQWGTFLRNHDELTLEMVSEEQRQWFWEAYAPDPRMRLNLGIRRRLAPLLDNNPRKILLANAILFSLPGTPIIYYGDEIGMGDNIDLPDRMGVRTPMQWDDTPNAGFSGAPSEALYAPVIDNAIYGYRRLNVSAQQAHSGSLYRRMQRLIQVRKQHRAFSRGSIRFVEAGNPAVIAFLRIHRDESFLILHNLTEEDQEAMVDDMALLERRGIEVLESQGHSVLRQRASLLRTMLAPYQSLWLWLMD